MSNKGDCTTVAEQPVTQEGSEHDSLTLIRAADEPLLVSLQDHFTLPTGSNVVRFRDKKNAARVYEAKGVQMIMEETYNEEKDESDIIVRRLEDETVGVQFLRAVYSLVCALWTGFFFVFCLQVLLFLVLDLSVVVGNAGNNSSSTVVGVIGVILTFCWLVHAFSEALVIAGHFIMDSWSGHFLVKQFVLKQLNAVMVEWIFFSFFLLVPLFVMCVMLLAQSANWWSVTAIVWFGCILSFFILFCANIVFYEVQAAYSFARNLGEDRNEPWYNIVKRCIELRQVHGYSGKVETLYLARSSFKDTEETELVQQTAIYENTRTVSKSWWTQITMMLPESLFERIEPERLYTIDDVQDYRPFLTYNTWSLERIFCRPSRSRYITIVHGPGALDIAQIRSSLICSIIGTILIILILVSFLVWFHIPGGFVALAFFIFLFFAWSALSNTRNLMKVGPDLVKIRFDLKAEYQAWKKKRSQNPEVEPAGNEVVNDVGNPDPSCPRDEPEGGSRRAWEIAGAVPSQAVYLVAEYQRVNKATNRFGWIMFGIEVVVLFVFPLITLGFINWDVALLFFIAGGISGIRHYINLVVLIEETGNMDLVGGKTDKDKWWKKSRLNDIVSAISVSRAQNAWLAILGAAALGFVAIFLAALGTSPENQGNKDAFIFLPNFYYEPLPDNNMQYPTCQLSMIDGGFGPNSTMADFAFLASSAYWDTDITQDALDSWFGTNRSIDSQDYVDNFREMEDQSFNKTKVFFKMVSFPDQKLAMIIIRGTSNPWDMLADSQLWSAAALMQGVRAVMPAGEIWTPIFNRLVYWINTLQGQAIDKVSFYKLTTKFAQHLKNDFEHVQVTGHSLGGGLSIITGAQAGIPAVALSGPNALISGKSFKPPVTREQLNNFTFNIIPNRDIVPMLDDPADQIQRIRCTSEPQDFIGCHFSKRSFCEILYTCGTGNRPAVCECHTEYGYPKPLTHGDEDFDSLCPSK